MGVEDAGWGWGTTFFDANNDGWLDLAATNGYFLRPLDSSRFWLNEMGESFADLSNESGFNDELVATTLVSADFDNDGLLDLLQSVKGKEVPVTPVRYYRNVTVHENAGHSMVIKPRMKGPNTFAIGAVVKIRTDDMSQMRLITAGTSFYGQEPAEAFFGVGNNREVDEVSIEWPDGLRSRWFNVKTGRIHVLINDDTLAVTDTISFEVDTPDDGEHNPDDSLADVVLGTDNLFREELVIVFPNPSDGSFRILIENDFYGLVEVEVVNAAGMSLTTEVFRKNSERFSSTPVTVNGKGLFFVKTVFGDQVFCRKLLIH